MEDPPLSARSTRRMTKCRRRTARAGWYGTDGQGANRRFRAPHAGVPSVDAVIETDRYITMPGQALSYKIGQFEIERQRAAASERGGAAFSLAAFHDRLLSLGSLPLTALRRELDGPT